MRISAWCRAHGADVALVVIPTAAQVYDERWQEVRHRWDLREEDFDRLKPQRLLRGLAADSGMGFIDLLPALRRAAAQAGGPLYYEADPHWTPRGHEVAASEIAAGVIAAGVPGRRPANWRPRDPRVHIHRAAAGIAPGR